MYMCEDEVGIRVVDCDLNTDDLVVETTTVTIASSSEPQGETVLLMETAAETSDFRGTITISAANAEGVLQVADGDVVTATYIDADDGEGHQNVTVTDTAVVDCASPVISGVQVADANPFDALITFQTDEPTEALVRYGLACGALTGVATQSGFGTDHAVIVSGLSENTTYYFVVEAEDEAGNGVTDDNGGNCYTFATPDIPNYFTEQFSSFDLDNRSLIFTPNGSNDFYAGCVEEIDTLPTNPTGGTTVTLSDDSYQQVTVGGGQTVKLYGVSYSTFYIGSNGYITFTAGDNDYDESLADHFDLPRISALYDDLYPPNGGTISWKQLADRVAVTWYEIREITTGNINTFQIEMFFDGTITIDFLSVGLSDCITGLSAGGGIPTGFYQTDLSEMGSCGPQPPAAQNSSASTAVSVPVMVSLVASDDGLPNPPGALTYIVTSLPAHGDVFDPAGGQIVAVPYTVLGGGHQLTYQPDGGYRPSDSFQLKANDGGVPPEGGDSNIATVSITIGGVLWDPVAYHVNTSTAVSTPVNVVLSASDPNGDPLTYVIESLPTEGALFDPSEGPILTAPYPLSGGAHVVRYEPPAGAHLVASFTYTAQDATAGSNTATVTVTVGGPAYDPVAHDQAVTIAASAPAAITLQGTDPNGDPLTYVIESVPALGLLFDAQGGPIQSAPYPLGGGGQGVAYVPPYGQTYGETFTFSVHDATAGSNPATVTVNVGEGIAQVAYSFPMDSDPGWTTTGAWAFGQPTGGGTHNRDPAGGHTGVNVYGYNLFGDYTNNLPARPLTMTLDCHNLTAVELRFWRWLGVEAGQFDAARVEASSDGVNWTTLWENPAAVPVADTAWTPMTLDLSAVADAQAAVQVRWVIGPTDHSGTYPGWNIDDVEIWAIVNTSCEGIPAGDVNGDGAVNGLDIEPFVTVLLDPYAQTVGPEQFCAADVNADGFVLFDDVEAFVAMLLEE